MDKQSDRSSLGVQFNIVPPPRGEDEVAARHQANRAGWNEAAHHYAAQVQETIEFLRSGGSNLHPIERRHLGALREWCSTAIHLQCASGKDTLSLWNEGVEHIIGVDISEVHIENAKRTATAIGAPARWFCCDVLETPAELDGSADLIYTGRGSLCWLHDLDRWAAVVRRLLRPGGVLHVLDDHPLLWLFDPEASDLRHSGLNYFDHCEWSRGWPETYINTIATQPERQAVKYERAWPLSAVFSACRRAGLVVEHLGEHAEGYWNSMPNVREELVGCVPLTFSLMARRLSTDAGITPPLRE